MCVYIRECYSAIKKKSSQFATQMDLEGIVISERQVRPRQILCDMTICGMKKNGTNEYNKTDS